MKKAIIIAMAICLAGSASFAQAKKDTSIKHAHKMTSTKKYTCTMHPDVVMDKPGKCPKCGMALVPMKAKGKKTSKPMEDMKMN